MLHSIPKEYVAPIIPEIFEYRYNQSCSHCGIVITERTWTDHDDCALTTIEASDYSEFWWCEHPCHPRPVMHVYRSQDTYHDHEQALEILGVEYACQPCLRGECPDGYAA